MASFVGISCLLMCILVTSQAVPLSMVMNSPGIVIPNALDEDPRDSSFDDFTTHPLERLSSAATCLVAGVEYTHGQQIYRHDQCEFCLCLDGEMFCWWQECPPTQDGPCKDRAPFTACQNGDAGGKSLASKVVLSTTMRAMSVATTTTALPMPPLLAPPGTTHSDEEFASSTDIDFDATETSTEMRDVNRGHPAEHNAQKSKPVAAAAPTSSSSTEVPKVCTVMGRHYNIGDWLPHDTGNCVECICGNGAQITCSPHQCAPARDTDEISDYRPPDLRAAQPDVF